MLRRTYMPLVLYILEFQITVWYMQWGNLGYQKLIQVREKLETISTLMLSFSLKTYPKVFCLSTFFRYLPREVDPLVYNMSHEDPGNISYSEVGGLSEQIRELREVCTKGICVLKASAVQMQSIISINILSVSWSAYNQHPLDNLFDTPLSHD